MVTSKRNRYREYSESNLLWLTQQAETNVQQNKATTLQPTRDSRTQRRNFFFYTMTNNPNVFSSSIFL